MMKAFNYPDEMHDYMEKNNALGRAWGVKIITPNGSKAAVEQRIGKSGKAKLYYKWFKLYPKGF